MGEQHTTETRTHTRLGLPLSVSEPLPADWRERVQAAWPNGARLTAAFELANDLDTCRDLLEGKPIDVERLRPDGYRKARQRRLITLQRPADLFNVQDAA